MKKGTQIEMMNPKITMTESNAETDYRKYVEKFAKCNHITVEEAEQHLIVKDVKKYYENYYKEKGQS